MSILSFPRLNFRGVFRCNPCTANNDDVMPDVVTRDSCNLGSNLTGMTDTEIAAYLREIVCMANYGETAPCTRFVRSGWNLYGNHWTNFQDTLITSGLTSPTAKVVTPSQDPIIGQGFTMLGSVGNGSMRRGDPVMVDLDPTGLVTTQIWLGGIQIGNNQGGQPIVINYDTRCFQNWLNFNSTVGTYGGEQNFVGISCMMQFAIPNSALPQPSSVQSPTLQALLQQAQQGQGIVCRWRIWEVQPGMTDEQLGALFSQGQAASNYAFGYLLGSLGVWGNGEPATEPAGRKLTALYPPGGNRPQLTWQSQDGTASGTVPGCPNPWSGPPALIGNVVAQVQPSLGVISLDIVNAFPKYGFRDPDGPNTPSAQGFKAPVQMATVGTVGLFIHDGSSNPPQLINEFDYGVPDYDTFANFGGIVDVPYNTQQTQYIDANNLCILGTFDSPQNAGVAMVYEEPIRIVTDERTLYMPYGSQAQVGLYVTQRGGPTTAPVTLNLIEYMNIIEVDSDPPPCEDGFRPNQSTSEREPTSTNRLSFPTTITIPAGFQGVYPVTVTGVNGGAALLNFQFDTTVMGSSVPAWSTCTYSSIRVYMNDDYSAVINSGNIPWDFVYAEVLRYYYVLFPAMSTIIPLNLPDSITSRGSVILERLGTPADPIFWQTYNMPVTRTMSPGRVELLKAWINQEMAKQANAKVS